MIISILVAIIIIIITIMIMIMIGVRTNGVFAEAPQFPVINVRGQIWTNCCNMWQHMAACAHLHGQD